MIEESNLYTTRRTYLAHLSRSIVNLYWHIQECSNCQVCKSCNIKHELMSKINDDWDMARESLGNE